MKSILRTLISIDERNRFTSQTMLIFWGQKSWSLAIKTKKRSRFPTTASRNANKSQLTARRTVRYQIRLLHVVIRDLIAGCEQNGQRLVPSYTSRADRQGTWLMRWGPRLMLLTRRKMTRPDVGLLRAGTCQHGYWSRRLWIDRFAP